MKVKTFEEEIGLIRNETIREFVRATLRNVPDYFFTAQASSTGKYHPECTIKKGGLVIHVKRAVCLADRLCNGWGIEGEDRDVVLAATILHDIAKCENYQNYEQYENHPINAKNIFVKVEGLADEIFEKINSCVAHHMGLWTPESIKKPLKEYSLLELLVYTSDYYSAMKTLALPVDNKLAPDEVPF